MKTINAQTIINEAMAALAAAPEKTGSDFFDKIKIKTSERGYQLVQNNKSNIQKFIDWVRKNAAAFGGGLVKTQKPRAAVSWPANLVSLFKQSIEDHDYRAALDIGDRLGALFFTSSKGNVFMQVAPVPCEFSERVVSVCNEDGKFSVIDPVSMRALTGLTLVQKRTRAAQAENVRLKLESMPSFDLDAALDKQSAFAVDQSLLRAQWILEHGMDSEAIETRIDAHNAQIEEQASQDVAQVVAQALATIAITEAMSETSEDTRELVTCEAGESEASTPTAGRTSWAPTPQYVPPSLSQVKPGAPVPPAYRGGMDDTDPSSDGNAEPTPAPMESMEYSYAMVNRPFGVGTAPKEGFLRIDARPSQDEPHHAMSRHGIAVYSRQLSDKETRDFELAPIADGAMLSELCAMVYADMVHYVDGYIGMASKRWTDFQSHVMQTLNRLTASYRVSIPSDCDFADMVLKALAKTWKEQNDAKNAPIVSPEPPTPSVQKKETSPAVESADFSGDIPLSLAVSAFGGVSMSPERLGASSKSEYGQSMAADYETLHAQAVKGGTLDLLPEVFARYRARQASAYRAYLSSSSRCVSSFIAGPANFPVARMQKRNDITHLRLTEYLDGGKMALQSAIRQLRPDLRAIMSGDADAIDRLTVKIEAAERAQAQMKAANKAIRANAKQGEAHQVSALMDLGYRESDAVSLLHPQFSYQGQGFPSYSLTNNNANIRRMKERLEQISKAQAQEVQAVECANGVTLEDDAPANRVRLYFPGKPSEEIRDELKSSGFRWAPSVGAWQAYRNYRTLATAKRMAGEPVQAEENAQDAAPEAEIVPMVESEATPPVMENTEVHTPAVVETAPALNAQNLAASGYAPTVAESIEKHGLDSFGPMAQAEIVAKLAKSSLRDEWNSAKQVNRIESKSGKWIAWLWLTSAGVIALGFSKHGQTVELSTYVTSSERMKSLQAMARAIDAPDDTPPGSKKPVDADTSPSPATVSSEALGGAVAVSTGFEPVDCDYGAIDAACKAMRKASESSAKEQAAKDHEQALIDLPLQYPQLRRSESKYAGGKLAAVNARILLKQAFKGIKFSVTSDYNSLRIVWTDGPTDGQVNEIVGRFDIGASDAQSDYFYTVSTAFSDLFGGVQYLSTNRETSDTLIQQAIDQLYTGMSEKPTVQDYRKCTGVFDWNGSNYENRRMRETLETISK